MRPALAVPTAVLAAGAATVGYATLVERVHWTLRRFTVPVLPAGQRPLTVLHISDLHMTAAQTAKRDWVAALDALDPDLVVNTGDNLAGHDTVPIVLAAQEALLDRPGLFCLASNDYYAPRPKNPLKYFKTDHKRVHGDELPWRDLRDGMLARGWADVTNGTATIEVDGRTIAVRGVDDPHLQLDDYDSVAGPADATADLRLGLVHSPEPRVLDRFAADGHDLLLSGHTHGGQLRVPFYGALVTNCGISRDKARWLHRWTGDTWLHVSAGMGTSPYAPYRFCCPPEATLLTLVPEDTAVGTVR